MTCSAILKKLKSHFYHFIWGYNIKFRTIPLREVEIKDTCFKNVTVNVTVTAPILLPERLETFMSKDCNQAE